MPSLASLGEFGSPPLPLALDRPLRATRLARARRCRLGLVREHGGNGDAQNNRHRHRYDERPPDKDLIHTCHTQSVTPVSPSRCALTHARWGSSRSFRQTNSIEPSRTRASDGRRGPVLGGCHGGLGKRDSPHNVFFRPLALVETRKNSCVKHTRHDVTGFAELLEAIRDEVVVVPILQRIGCERDWEADGIEPLGNSAVDGDLEPRKP